jgi:predicted SAM-dependent methyltransferase
MVKLHLGCGSIIKPGWINIDIERGPGIDKVHDLTKPLDFIASGAVDYIYSEHFIEHLERHQGEGLLRDCRRMLKPAGVVRISCPNLYTLVNDYMNQKIDRWAEGWMPETPCRMINEGMRLWGHKFLYDLPELDSLLRGLGFAHVTPCQYGQSSHDALKGLETRPNCDEIFIEATK